MMIDTAEVVLEEVCAPNNMKNKLSPTVYLILQMTYNNQEMRVNWDVCLYIVPMTEVQEKCYTEYHRLRLLTL